MKKIKVIIVGFGNIGQYCLNAVLNENDMELVGIVGRVRDLNSQLIPTGIEIQDDFEKLKNKSDVDCAIICTQSRKVEETSTEYLKRGICTVDSFDIHQGIVELRRNLDKVAKENGAVSIISAGWDPGSDSVVRALMQAMAPRGITHTNFGTGMSMGHSVVAKSKDGVKNALSITVPLGSGIHRRVVYVELENGANIAEVTKLIKEDEYFAHDETHVIETGDVSALMDKGHGVNMVRKGVSGTTDNQLLEFNMKINNPALTSQILVSCARAVTRQKAGAYTMIEIPVIDLLCGEREDLIEKLV